MIPKLFAKTSYTSANLPLLTVSCKTSIVTPVKKPTNDDFIKLLRIELQILNP